MTAFVFDFKLAPNETEFAEGERGFENGCAMPADVAAGMSAVLEDAVVEGSNWGREVENF